MTVPKAAERLAEAGRRAGWHVAVAERIGWWRGKQVESCLVRFQRRQQHAVVEYLDGKAHRAYVWPVVGRFANRERIGFRDLAKHLGSGHE